MVVRADAKSARLEKAAKALPKVEKRRTERRHKVYPATKGNQRAVKSGGITLRNQAIIDAVIDPSTLDNWDEEELARGYRRDKNGNFTGRPPKYIPYVVAMEISRRATIQAVLNMAKLQPRAMRTLQKVMQDDNNRMAQVAAAKLVLERVAPVQSLSRVDVSVKAEPRFLKVLEACIEPGDLDDDIIDGEVIE